MKRAVFPGSFDPITKGHESIVRRAIPLFDEIIVAVGYNSTKKSAFSLDKRMNMLKKTFVDVPSIRVDSYTGLTIDFCTKVDASFIIRGLRTSSDFNYERSIAQMNRALNDTIETVLIICEPEFSAISSTIIRDIFTHGGDPKLFMPDALKDEDLL